MNVLVWTLSQFQGEPIRAYTTQNLLSAYDWERLLRWRSRGPETLESWLALLELSRLRMHGYDSSTIPRAATTRTDT